jgi:hypothetical protein
MAAGGAGDAAARAGAAGCAAPARADEGAGTGAQGEGTGMSYDRGPSITLLELWERQSSKGNVYFSGYWGNLSLALLRDGERPHPTRPDETTVVVWKLVAQERDRPAPPRRSPPERDAPPAPPAAALSAGAPPAGPGRRFRREGKAARQERVSAEIARGYGLESDPDDPPLPF